MLEEEQRCPKQSCDHQDSCKHIEHVQESFTALRFVCECLWFAWKGSKFSQQRCSQMLGFEDFRVCRKQTGSRLRKDVCSLLWIDKHRVEIRFLKEGHQLVIL